MDELCAGTVSPEMLTLKGVSKVFGQGGGYTGESSEGDAAWEGCLWVCLSVSPPLQINPSPGGDQCCLFGLLWWFPAAGRAGVLQGSARDVQGTGCSLSLGLAVPSVPRWGEAPPAVFVPRAGWEGAFIHSWDSSES